MKTTKDKLKQLIIEELANVISEQNEAKCKKLEAEYNAAFDDSMSGAPYDSGKAMMDAKKAAQAAGCGWASESDADSTDKAEAKEPNVRAAMEEIARVRKTMDWVDSLEASMDKATNNPKELKVVAEQAVEHLRKAMKALETAENAIDSLRKS